MVCDLPLPESVNVLVLAIPSITVIDGIAPASAAYKLFTLVASVVLVKITELPLATLVRQPERVPE